MNTHSITRSLSPRMHHLLFAGLLFGGAANVAAAQGQVLSQITSTPNDPDEDFTAVSSVDDLDGDGAPDFVVAIPQRLLVAGPNSGNRGVLEARSSRTGQVLWTHENSDPQNAYFGQRLGVIGDVDGDGFIDLVVASYVGSSLTQIGVGALVVSGRTGLGLYNKYQGPQIFAGFSVNVASVGDVDGDGLDDWVLGDEYEGSLQLFSGGTGVRLARVVGGYLGFKITVLEDLDGDGVVDIAASTQQGGILHIRSGATLASITQFTRPQAAPGFGTQVVLVDDLDGDGVRDLFVTTIRGVGHTSIEGYTISTGTGANIAQFAIEVGSAGGFGATLVADLDGDGVRDIAMIHSRDNSSTGTSRGAIVFLSPVTGLEVGRIDFSMTGSGDLHPLTSAGDIDGNGADELLHLAFDAVTSTSRVEIRQVVTTDQFWYCGGAPVNSTGAPGQVDIAGSTSVAASNLRLQATNLPSMSFGFFIVSETPESSPATSGLGARVCVGGAIGRLIGPGQVQSTGTQGRLDVPMDLNLIPSPTGFMPPPIQGSLYVQAWYRDLLPTGALTSHLSDAYSFVVLP